MALGLLDLPPEVRTIITFYIEATRILYGENVFGFLGIRSAFPSLDSALTTQNLTATNFLRIRNLYLELAAVDKESLLRFINYLDATKMHLDTLILGRLRPGRLLGNDEMSNLVASLLRQGTVRRLQIRNNARYRPQPEVERNGLFILTQDAESMWGMSFGTERFKKTYHSVVLADSKP
ncbi:uncharacterized protein KY384_007501 [Bacidia gigantensis]|uniref:uncharacterized protein n=1 Tax=Bacidia gigantensis TaxID=2732470 RepID=UPI001D03713C|nr:uncharacterized protein KY384_007501 [Bacidia gigantensis]KAG8527349.1 hypothetical protein KY384_007501 [Bacidia gigantensis]